MNGEILEKALAPALTDLVDKGSFREVLGNYRTLFDLTVRVFDKENSLISEAAREMPACQRFCTTEQGKKQCIATRMKVKRSIPVERRLVSVDCLSGLRYTAAPICFQGAVVGKLVLGPYKPDDAHDMLERATRADIDLTETRGAVAAMRPIPSSLIRRIAGSMLSVLDAVLFSAHKALLTSEMHIASVRDAFETITEKNRELEEMNERMKAFERLKSSFLSTISHELRTPLTSIIGYSDLLSEGIAGALDQEQRQFVDTIKTKGEELLRLISNILDFTQIETGHLSISAAGVEPAALIEEAVGRAQENAGKRGVRISCAIRQDLEPVSLDAEKIQSALHHLIDNAVKFSPPGSVVRVSAEVTEDGPGDDDELGFVLNASPRWLAISVQDYGNGIPPKDQELIFSPFTQLDNSTTREHGGAGLGLALVKQFVEAHGGTVTIASTPNEGSKFTIRLPVGASDS